MGDTLNALSGAIRSGNVLDSIAHPQVLNPLAAFSTATDVASRVYDLRDKQATAAWGDVLQQATDENGNVDYPRAQALAARNPMAQQGMLRALGQTSQLRGEQLAQTGATLALYGKSALTIAQNPSDANVNATFDSLAAAGWPKAQLEAERQRVLAMTDPNARVQYALQHGLQAMDGVSAFTTAIGGRREVNTGGNIQFPWIPGYAGGSPSFNTTMTPGESMSYGVWTKDPKTGQPVWVSGPDLARRAGLEPLIPPQLGGGGGGGAPNATNPPRDASGNIVGPNNPARLSPGSPPGQSGPPAPPAWDAPPAPVPGAPAAPYTGGGVGSVLSRPGGPGGSPASPPPVVAAPPPPPPPAGRDSMTPAPRAAIQGDVNAILAGMQQARQPGGPATALAAGPGAPTAGLNVPSGVTPAEFRTVPLGPTADQGAVLQASPDRLKRDLETAANYPQTMFANTQALRELGRGTVTGPNAEFLNRVAGYIRTPLEKLGINVGSLANANERADALKKWYANIVSQTPFAAGSDARMAEVLNGTPNMSISQAASEDMLKAGQILMRMNVAAPRQWMSMSPEQQAQYGTYINFVNSYASVVDPRAFGVDMYNAAQMADLRKQLQNGSEADAKRFNDSLAIARSVPGFQPLPTR